MRVHGWPGDPLGADEMAQLHSIPPDVVDTVRGATAEVRPACSASCPPRGRGAAVYMGMDANSGASAFVTAAHVVCPRLGAPVWPHIGLRPHEGDEWFAATSGIYGKHHDVGVLLAKTALEPTQRMRLCINDEEPNELVKEGVHVAYAGYPLDEPPNLSRLVFARGMIAGHIEREDEETGTSHMLYVIDGMVNAGMSGGPVFIPNTGSLVAVIIETVTSGASGVGHGWGHAIPIQEALVFANILEEYSREGEGDGEQ